MGLASNAKMKQTGLRHPVFGSRRGDGEVGIRCDHMGSLSMGII